MSDKPKTLAEIVREKYGFPEMLGEGIVGRKPEQSEATAPLLGIPRKLGEGTNSNKNSLSDKLKRSMSDRIALLKKDPKQALKEFHRDIFFGHMDNCTDVYKPGSKDLEDCLVNAIRKDATNWGILGIVPNFISSQKEKIRMLEEKEAKKSE